MFNRFPDPDFLFDLLYITGSISNRLGSAEGRYQLHANARLTRHGMFAMKPEMEIWPCAGCFRFVGESAWCTVVSDKIRRISSETAEIYRVKLGPSAQTGIACINSKSSRFP